MNAFFKKLLTKPIWWWERFLSRAQKSLPALPPINIPPNRTPLVIQTTPATLSNGLWGAYSLLTYLQKNLSLILVLDAPAWPQNLAAQAQALFPGVELQTTLQQIEKLPAHAPALKKFTHTHPLGRKLCTILTLNTSSAIIFSDDDILALAPLTELISWSENPAQALILQEATTGRDPALDTLAQSQGLRSPAHFNSGLMALPKGFLSIEKANELLSRVDTEKLSWFAETTLLAYQLSDAAALPASTYVVNCQRQFFFEPDVDYTQIKLRHFVGPVRHLLRLRGIPAFLKSCS